jgi:Xaa-Pro aminopeptidase
MINKQRLERAQERMRQVGIDAYLVLTHDDYIYFFGEDRFQPRAIIPAAGPPIVVAFRGEEEEIKESLGVDDVRIFATVGQQIKDVVEVMQQLAGGKPTLTIGVQMWFSTPAFLLNMFQRANPQVKVADIAPVMDELRMIKDAEEIALMRRAGEIAAVGMQVAVKTLRPGVSENEVAAEIEYAMRKAGGHGTATPVYVNSGVRSCWLHGTATERKIKAADWVVIDLVPKYQGYCANLCRTFVVGEPTEKQQVLFNVYKRAQAAGREALKPGTRMKDIDAAAKAIFDEAGYGDYYVFGISHSIGLSFEETPAPTIHPGHAGLPVREGMTLTVGHSVLSVPGIGGVRLEDTFHISADGPTPLTSFPVELAAPAEGWM